MKRIILLVITLFLGENTAEGGAKLTFTPLGKYNQTLLNAINYEDQDALVEVAQKINDFNAAEKEIILDRQDDQGNTPLHKAVQYTNGRAIKILLSLKANASIRNKKNDTSIDLAAAYSPNYILPIFMQAGFLQKNAERLS